MYDVLPSATSDFWKMFWQTLCIVKRFLCHCLQVQVRSLRLVECIWPLDLLAMMSLKRSWGSLTATPPTVAECPTLKMQ